MKNKQLGFYLIPLLAIISNLCYAQNNLFVGIGVQDFSLIEKDLYTGIQLVKEQGNIPTIIYGLDWPINPKLHFQAQVQQSYGVMPYDGQTQSGIPHHTLCETSRPLRLRGLKNII